MKKVGLIALSVVLLAALLLTGCAGTKEESITGDGNYYSEAEYPAEAPEPSVEAEKDANGGGGSAIEYDDSILQPIENRKIIYYGTINAQTEKFTEDYNAIMAKLKELGGYEQYESMTGTPPEEWQDTGRYVELTLRVPSDKFDAFMNFLRDLGETISAKVNTEDVSLQYFDIETKLQTLRTREARLLSLLEKAATMEDIISLEQALSDVSYEIQSLEMNLRDYDSLIDYSSVTITLQEVQVIEKVTASPKTLGERITTGFYSVLNVLADIGEQLLVILVGGFPVWLILGAALVTILLVRKHNKKKRAQKKAEHVNAPGIPGVYYDPKTGYPYYNNTGMPDAGPKEKENEVSDKDNKKKE